MEKHSNSTISKLAHKIRNLNANFKRLESGVQFRKKVNDGLVKQACLTELHTAPLRKLCRKVSNILKLIFVRRNSNRTTVSTEKA